MKVSLYQKIEKIAYAGISLFTIFSLSVYLYTQVTLLVQNNIPDGAFNYSGISLPWSYFTTRGFQVDEKMVIQEAVLELDHEVLPSPYHKDIFYTMLSYQIFIQKKNTNEFLCLYLTKESYLKIYNSEKQSTLKVQCNELF